MLRLPCGGGGARSGRWSFRVTVWSGPARHTEVPEIAVRRCHAHLDRRDVISRRNWGITRAGNQTVTLRATHEAGKAVVSPPAPRARTWTNPTSASPWPARRWRGRRLRFRATSSCASPTRGTYLSAPSTVGTRLPAGQSACRSRTSAIVAVTAADRFTRGRSDGADREGRTRWKDRLGGARRMPGAAAV